jgi:hypothetical protein
MTLELWSKPDSSLIRCPNIGPTSYDWSQNGSCQQSPLSCKCIPNLTSVYSSACRNLWMTMSNMVDWTWKEDVVSKLVSWPACCLFTLVICCNCSISLLVRSLLGVEYQQANHCGQDGKSLKREIPVHANNYLQLASLRNCSNVHTHHPENNRALGEWFF